MLTQKVLTPLEISSRPGPATGRAALRPMLGVDREGGQAYWTHPFSLRRLMASLKPVLAEVGIEVVVPKMLSQIWCVSWG